MQTTSPFYPHCMEVLSNLRYFRIPHDQLDIMLQGFRRETWEKGVRIEIDTLERFVVVTRGRIELIRTDYSSGRDLTIFLLHPGDAFDVITLLDGEPHDLTPIALDQVDLLSIPLDSAREWLRTHPEFNQQFLPYLGHQMRALENLATDLAFHDTVTRLGRLLTQHLLPNQQPLTKTSQSFELLNNLTHETLARMIGSVRVVVSRHIQHWKHNGTVSTGRKHLTIRNLQGLLNGCDKIEASILKKNTP